MKSPCPQDEQIALTAINGLKGQAQYDFLMDYFKQLRAEGRKQERAKVLEEVRKIIDKWAVTQTNKPSILTFDVDELKAELSKLEAKKK